MGGLADYIAEFHERLEQLRVARGEDPEPPEEEQEEFAVAVEPEPPLQVEVAPPGPVQRDAKAGRQCMICESTVEQLVTYRGKPMCSDCRDLLIHGHQ